MKKRNLTFGLAFLFGFFAVFILALFANSLFIQKKDRVNILVHMKDKITYYSISTTDDVNYLIYFYPDSKIIVPGGYKYYRFGALAKLAELEKKQEILKKSFSSATSSFTDFYFYPTKPEVLYGRSIPKEVHFPGLSDLFFTQSNANLLDRIYLLLRFLSSAKPQFTLLPSPKLEEDFAKAYQGFFYSKTYRNERRLVQIIYTKKYKTANLISRILEGNGIQVVNISYDDKTYNTCSIIENSPKFSSTAKDLSRFFVCNLQKGKTGTFDILFILGDKEDYWEA